MRANFSYRPPLTPSQVRSHLPFLADLIENRSRTTALRLPRSVIIHRAISGEGVRRRQATTQVLKLAVGLTYELSSVC